MIGRYGVSDDNNGIFTSMVMSAGTTFFQPKDGHRYIWFSFKEDRVNFMIYIFMARNDVRSVRQLGWGKSYHGIIYSLAFYF